MLLPLTHETTVIRSLKFPYLSLAHGPLFTLSTRVWCDGKRTINSLLPPAVLPCINRSLFLSLTLSFTHTHTLLLLCIATRKSLSHSKEHLITSGRPRYVAEAINLFITTEEFGPRIRTLNRFLNLVIDFAIAWSLIICQDLVST